MEIFLAALFAAVLMAPFLWPAFVMVYRYFRGLEDQRYERKHPTL